MWKFLLLFASTTLFVSIGTAQPVFHRLTGVGVETPEFLRSGGGSTVYTHRDSLLFKSTDEGSTWSFVRSFSGVGRVGFGPYLYVYPGKASDCYVIASGVLYSTSDAGLTWLTDSSRDFLDVVQTTPVLAAVMVNELGMGYAFSTDKGITWKDTTSWLPVVTLESGRFLRKSASWEISTDGVEWSSLLLTTPVFPGKDDDLWSLDTINRTILHSTNHGVTWRAEWLPAILEQGRFAVDGNRTIYYYDCETGRIDYKTNSRIYYSSNNGVSWDSLVLSPRVRGICVTSSRVLIHERNVTYDVIGGKQREVSRSIERGEFGNIHRDHNNQLWMTYRYNSYVDSKGTVLRSTDDGKSWYEVRQGFTGTSYVYGIIECNETLFAISTDTLQGPTILSKFNQALQTWERQPLVSELDRVTGLTCLDTLLFASTYLESVWSSIDNGQSWKFADRGLPGGVTRQITADNHGRLFVFPGPYISVDTAQSWQKLTVFKNLDVYERANLAVAKDGSIYATGKGAIYRTRDLLTVETIDIPGMKGSVYPIMIDSADNIWVRVLDTVLFSSDGGESWVDVPRVEVESGWMQNLLYLWTDRQGNSFATSYEGLYRTYSPSASVRKYNKGFKHDLTLISEDAVLSVIGDSKKGDELVLRVYDVTGREIASLSGRIDAVNQELRSMRILDKILFYTITIEGRQSAGKVLHLP